MTKSLFILLTFLLLSHTLLAQRTCGSDLVKASLIARDPSWEQRLQAQKASLQAIADNYKQRQKQAGARKTTSASAVPVIFHYMVTAAQYAQIGGAAGIQQRIDSQVAVLNRDYNRENPDSVLIPSGWKPLYASVGIHFALAHTAPSGYGSTGYELLIIPDLPGGFFGASANYSDAKHASTGGLDAWDVTKYLNIWVTNFADYPGLLGLTLSKSKTGPPPAFPVNEEGIVANYLTVGKRASPADIYYADHGDHFDLGRTLTHETGHFFEIWHTWGDDGGLCPWDTTGGSDDGLADTPPEGGPKYHAYAYDVPGGTYRDSCHFHTVEVQPYGCATLDFMNYTNDTAMQLFTPDQAAVMAAMVSDTGENYTLTQHSELLNWSPLTGIAQMPVDNSLTISPNPSAGLVYIIFDETKDELKQISVISILGRQMITVEPDGHNKNYYSIDLSGLNKGIYFVRCNFASGSITRKILLQ
jgi:hypothetical protein